MRALFDRLTIVLFTLALAAPTLDGFVRPDSARDCRRERRAPTPRPGLPRSMGEFTLLPRRLEKHHQDTFGLRDVLLRWNSREQWFLLGRSPSRVVDRGRNGWCILSDEDSRTVFRGLAPLDARALDGWVALLRERQRRLAADGIAYLFVIGPNKQTIYPEEVPEDWSVLGPTQLDQLCERLAREEDVPFLDLRPVLAAARAEDRPSDRLYTIYGSHWNGRGAYAVYRAILARLAPRFPALVAPGLDAFERRDVPGAPESLAHQLYLEDRLVQEQYEFVRRGGRGYEIERKTNQELGSVLVTSKPGAGPRLLWLHDSFGNSLVSLMCESFSHVQAHHTLEFPPGAPAEARPDVVLETYVERVLNRPTPAVGVP